MASGTTIQAAEPLLTQDTTTGGGRRRLCPHCSDLVSKSTYFRHKRIYYDSETRQWRTSTRTEADNRLSSASNTTRGGEAHDDSATPIDDGIIIYRHERSAES